MGEDREQFIRTLNARRESLLADRASFRREADQYLAKMRQIESKAHETEEALSHVNRLLEMEGVEIREEERRPEQRAPDLGQLLTKILSDGEVHAVDDLASQAQEAGFDFGEKSPKRTTNMTLLGLARAKDSPIHMVGKGNWMTSN